MNENKLEVYNNAEFGAVRTLVIDGEPYFVGKDVAQALGYGEGKSLANAVAKHVDDDDKGVTEMMTPGGEQKMTVINESGLYSLILSSKLPNAKKFKRWVTAEVLPAIRKHGSYNTDYSGLSPQLQYLISLEQKTKALEQKQTELENKLAESEKNRDEIIKATFEFGRIGELQRNEITKAVKKRAIELCRYAETYDKVGKSVISSIYKGLQKEFKVKSYLDLSYNQYTDCMIFIQYFFPDQKLDLKIMHEQPKPSMKIFEMLTET